MAAAIEPILFLNKKEKPKAKATYNYLRGQNSEYRNKLICKM